MVKVEKFTGEIPAKVMVLGVAVLFDESGVAEVDEEVADELCQIDFQYRLADGEPASEDDEDDVPPADDEPPVDGEPPATPLAELVATLTPDPEPAQEPTQEPAQEPAAPPAPPKRRAPSVNK